MARAARSTKRREQLERDHAAVVRAPITGCRRIVVVSRKGGVGKTTTTLNLGHTLAQHRHDRVIALDGNPDAGSLGYRVPRDTHRTITHLLVSAGKIARHDDVRAFTSQSPTGLEVLAADEDPRVIDALREEDYRRVVDVLQAHYGVICIDTGTGVLESASRGILELADQLVLVTSPSLDSGRAASSTIDWLEENGHEHFAAGAVAVINGTRPKTGMADLDRIEGYFKVRCRSVVRIPWDPALDARAHASLDELMPETRSAYLELGAHCLRPGGLGAGLRAGAG